MKTTVFTVLTGVSGREFTMRGNMFKERVENGLFLSSNNPDYPPYYYDFFSNVRSVSTGNPGFSAVPIDKYTIINNNTLNFTLSSFKKVQRLDVIFANTAGYELASRSKAFSYIQVISAIS